MFWDTSAGAGVALAPLLVTRALDTVGAFLMFDVDELRSFAERRFDWGKFCGDGLDGEGVRF
jgi:hypothetical protein